MEARAAHRRNVARGDRRWPRFRRRRRGQFKAYDDKTGKVLWEADLGSPVSGFPITYTAGGKQYVAVRTGPSLVAGGAWRVTPELKPGTGSQMFVFALP